MIGPMQYTPHESDSSVNHVHVLVPLHNLGSISHYMNEVHDCFRDITGVLECLKVDIH